MKPSQPNKNTALAIDQKVLQGVAKHFAKVKNVTLAGVSYTVANLTATLQAEIDGNDALDKARAQLKEQVASMRTTKAKAAAVRAELKAYVLGNYGTQAAQVLEDFGMSAPKAAGPKTAEARAQAAAKAVATKKAKAAAAKAATSAPSTAAQASPPAHVAQPIVATPVAAPAATTTAQ
jgi:hypothetical protein